MITDQRATIGVAEDVPGDLPSASDVGKIGTWTLSSKDSIIELHARFLGVSTSFMPRHNHPKSRPAHRNEKCRACRWFEPRIFREVGGQQRYLVHRTGRSVVPGEETYTSHQWVYGAHEVIEVLTTRRTGSDGVPFLTHPAARVLAQAASHDDELDDAYVNRAVA